MKKSTKTQWIKTLTFGKLQVLVAACLGILAGLFFGKFCLAIKPLADIFSMLLQAVVLPYVCFAIIYGLGSLSLEQVKRLWKSGWVYFFVVWILAFVVILGASYWIPPPNLSIITISSGNHSTRFWEKLLGSLIPQNPFYDLSNNILPAVALFGVILGVALMRLESRGPLLDIFDRMCTIFEKIFAWLIAIAPIGVFILAAVNFASVPWDRLGGLVFYLLVSTAIALLISAVLLPLLVCRVTSMSHSEARSAFVSVCFLPFATGLVALTIPTLIAYLRRKEPSLRAIASLAYTGGQIGNAMMIFFVLFLSYYFSSPFHHGEDIFLSMLSIPLALGSSANSTNAVSYLFQQLNFPKNALPLFAHALPLTNYFQALMSASAILTLTLLIVHAYERGVRRIGWRVAIPLGCTLIAIVALQPLMRPKDYYPHLYQNLRLADVLEHPVPAVVYTEQPDGNLRENPEQQFLEILRTRVLKVGYHALEMPYCYWNKEGELVGYDVAYAHQLARDLDCTLEFIPLVFGHLKEEIDAGLYDIAMSSIIMSEKRIVNMSFTAPYDEQTFVLIVPLTASKQYTHLPTVMQKRGLKIGATGVFLDVVRRHFPLAEAIDLTVDAQIAALLAGKLDAIVWERASAFIWSLTHPNYIAIDYSGLIGRGYLSYGFHTNSPKFASFLNNWLSLKKLSGFNEKMRNYWFDGVKEP